MKESVSEVLSKIIDSDDTTVGGGSASALSGAMAAGMIAMVAKLSKKKPVNFTVEQYDAIAEECDRLAEQLQEGCVRDTEAYCMIVDAFKLPKGTDEEKAARSAAVQAAATQAARVPRDNARLNARVLGQPDADPFYGAPTVVVVLADTGRPTWRQDGSLVMGNLMNAAASLGVGSCWIHRAEEVFDLPEGRALLEKWGLPATLRGVGHCILGYADGPAPAPKPRRDGRIVRV